MDDSWQILKFVKGYTINGGWIEFRDALGQLQSVRSDEVRRMSVEEPKSGNVPTDYEKVGARPGSESTSASEQDGAPVSPAADIPEEESAATKIWNETPE